MTKSHGEPLRFILVDDDPIYAKVLVSVAYQQGLIVDRVSSVQELQLISTQQLYAAAIVDFDLGDDSGVEAVGRIQQRLGAVPALLISDTPRRPLGTRHWPAAIRRFLLKSTGHHEILLAATQLAAASR